MGNFKKKIVMIKWNPAFSSYPMLVFLSELTDACFGKMANFSWSVWDHDKIRKGDTLFWLKVGYGQNGIVGKGIVISDPYLGEDWSGKERETYYVNFEPQVLINPDAWQLLDSKTLSTEIPNFDWTGGHSGIVLNEEQASKLEELWAHYMGNNLEAFGKAKSRDNGADRIYLFE